MDSRQLLKYFLLFVISFLLFSYFQHFPTFPDPDSFYHAKMAVLMRDQGIIRDFPWLQFTILKNYYADHHFFYHVLLIPFVTFFEPLVGIKLATATFAALLILTIFWFLSKFKIKGAFFYCFLLLTISPFIFRINLAKAGALSIIILLIGLYSIFNKKNWLLFILSFIYVWTHGSWPLIFFLTIVYILIDSFLKISLPTSDNKIRNQKLKIKNTNIKIKKYFYAFNLCILYFISYISFLTRQIFTKENFKLLSACLGGLLAGLIINPYFPKNLIFYWYQIIKIAVINYQNKIGVGAEWYPYNFGDLIASSSFVFILLILSFAAFFINFLESFSSKEKIFIKNKIEILAIALSVFFFLILTLKSRRNVEYFVPFAAILAAFSLNQPFLLKREHWAYFQKWWQQKRILANSLCLFFIIAIPFIAGRNIWSTQTLFASGNPANKYQGISEWLKNNTPEKALIFHNDWDDFPALFYYNTHNHYVAGLDPTFMYEYDQELYKKWVDITTSRKTNISQIIKNDFHAEYVFVDKDHIALENNLKSDGHFAMVYQDEDGKIYKLINK